jgi:hypothetical protein
MKNSADAWAFLKTVLREETAPEVIELLQRQLADTVDAMAFRLMLVDLNDVDVSLIRNLALAALTRLGEEIMAEQKRSIN